VAVHNQRFSRGRVFPHGKLAEFQPVQGLVESQFQLAAVALAIAMRELKSCVAMQGLNRRDIRLARLRRSLYPGMAAKARRKGVQGAPARLEGRLDRRRGVFLVEGQQLVVARMQRRDDASLIGAGEHYVAVGLKRGFHGR
jgi:hypothetical protein